MAANLRALFWATLDGEGAARIAARLGCKTRTVQLKQIELKLKKARVHQPWTEDQKAVVRREYAKTETMALAKRLNRTPGQIHQMAATLGQKKSHEFLSAVAREKLLKRGAPYRFKRRHIPWNKGLKHPKGWAPGRMAETQFKKGERSGQARPVGTISVDGEGYRRMKVREYRPGEQTYGFGNDKVWPLLHHWTWEQARGPIPPGHKIAFIDKDRGNCTLENLELISDAEMMRRNSVHNLPKDLELVIQLAGALQRQLRMRTGEGIA